ncbi:MAG: BlaI/MecI/CopY family transcriptional regulator [Alistipes sp.]
MKKETERENMRELTRAELEIMQILWDEKNAFVNDILERMPEPKPAYNTVSTIVRILEKKGAVGHEVLGKSHRYYPLFGREAYTQNLMQESSAISSATRSPEWSRFLRKGTLAGRRVRKILQIAQEAIARTKTNRVTRNRTAHPDPTVPQP